MFVEVLEAPSSVEFVVTAEISRYSHIMPLEDKEKDHSALIGGRN